MKVKYKEPYWVKFEWDIDEHHDNQYVTSFDKTENKVFNLLFHKNDFIITINFKIKNQYKKDNISMVFGKPGKNLGLAYNSDTKNLSFEFWTEDKFYQNNFKSVTQKEIEIGVIISVVKKGNEFILYKNFDEDSRISFENELTNDYKNSSLFIGCSNPDSDIVDNRYYCEFDINHFSILQRISDINIIRDLYYGEIHNLLLSKSYDDLLCFYDFKTINNLGIVYDESKYANFLEKVPVEYIK
jgi:hypothetical protein